MDSDANMDLDENSSGCGGRNTRRAGVGRVGI